MTENKKNIDVMIEINSTIDSMHKIYDDIHVEKVLKLPKAVCNRLDWVFDYEYEGLTPCGVLNAMTSEDEHEIKDFEFGGEWKPFSKEYRDWLNKEPFHDLILMRAIMFSYEPEKEANDDKRN